MKDSPHVALAPVQQARTYEALDRFHEVETALSRVVDICGKVRWAGSLLSFLLRVTTARGDSLCGGSWFHIVAWKAALFRN